MVFVLEILFLFAGFGLFIPPVAVFFQDFIEGEQSIGDLVERLVIGLK